MDSTRLHYLYDKCIRGTATEEERAEYLDKMQLPENEPLARELLHKAFLEEKEMEDLSGPAAAAVLQAILQVRSEQGSAADTEEKLVLRPGGGRRYWVVLGMAAAVLGLILTGAFFLFKQDKEKEPLLAAHPAPEEITPADNRAVLTLADGTMIRLDEMGDGALEQQGAVQVVKEGSGRLVYKQINAADQPDSRLQQNGAIAYNRLTTPRGGLFQVTLPDGSRVWLNSASSLKYPASFSGQERRVELTGEGYFEVAADKSRPFFVALNNMQVQVLGTDFNVMAYEDEEAVRTSLVSGSVCIISGEETVTVKPGQQASRLKENGRVVLSVPNMEEVLGWRNGQMSFSSAALPAIMRQISRWYDVDIKYADGIPPGRFNGLIDRNLKLSNVLEVLEVYGIHSKLEGRTVTVLP